MTTLMTRPPAASVQVANPGPTPMMLNHTAWVTRDVEATANF
jgi:hypothetical protein